MASFSNTGPGCILYGLSPLVELDVEGLGRGLFCHASPRNDVDIFVETTPEEHVAPLFRGVSADLVVVGHNHVRFERRVGRVRVVNAGSVGMAYEEEPRRALTPTKTPMSRRRGRKTAAGSRGSSPSPPLGRA